ncbi:sensor histidine kinase [Umezawaea tangerina]|uniref:histidine kinase n=1 Tax=Umezawaea tangerina TaxID=84725 RepID=A0A2T0TA44_9PSEU|nr:histidine kinase [Umezawaea tangerina]PRY42536.1 signal transduction histidine kinase [Umezawaea tangerina]
MRWARRTWGAAALSAVAPVAVWNTLAVTGGPVPPPRVLLGLALLVPGYLVGRRVADGRAPVLACVLGAVCTAVLAREPWNLAEGPVGVLATVVFPWFAGRYRRQHLELAERLRQDVRLARQRERTRIARDMHDSLGHELTLVALRAGALELSSDLAEPHRRAAGELRAGAGAATERLHEIIGLLRDDTEDISSLVDRSVASGMTVRLVGDRSASRTAYRVVQESLTNAAKHAPGAPVEVRLRHTPTDLVVSVVNAPPTGGHGLVGLAERLRLAGGTLDAATRPDGGFAVVATMRKDAG